MGQGNQVRGDQSGLIGETKDRELVALSIEIKRRATRRIGQLIQHSKPKEAGKLAKGTRGQLPTRNT
jgi:hypothetical protein